MGNIAGKEFDTQADFQAYLEKNGVNSIIEFYNTTVQIIAQKLWNPAVEAKSGVTFDDLVNTGLMRIFEYLSDWNPEISSFTTKALPLVHFRMIDFIRENSSISRLTLRRWAIISKFISGFKHSRPGPEPTIDEIAEGTGLSREQVLEVIDNYREQSFQQYSYSGCGLPRGESDKVGDFTSYEADTAASRRVQSPEAAYQLEDVLRRIYTRLNLFDRLFIHGYLFLGLTMKDMGVCLGLSESRCSQAALGALAVMNQEAFAKYAQRMDNGKGSFDIIRIQPYTQAMWQTLSLESQNRIVQDFDLAGRFATEDHSTAVIDVESGWRVVGLPSANITGNGVLLLSFPLE